jgi:hypothetical protein
MSLPEQADIRFPKGSWCCGVAAVIGDEEYAVRMVDPRTPFARVCLIGLPGIGLGAPQGFLSPDVDVTQTDPLLSRPHTLTRTSNRIRGLRKASSGPCNTVAAEERPQPP